MKYTLKSNIALRGWEYLPNAISNYETGECAFLSQKQYDFLRRYLEEGDSISSIDLISHSEFVRQLKEHDIITPCNEGDTLTEWQEMKRFPNRYMHQAHWAVTGDCNYRCRHCNLSAPHALYGELSLSDCLHIVDQLAETGILNVSFTGGEVFFRKDIFTIIDALLERKIGIKQIFTNGALVSEKVLEALKERRVNPSFEISFDGCGWHDWLRNVKGSEKRITKTFGLLQKYGFDYSTGMVIHQNNRHTLRDTVLFLAEHGVKSLKASKIYDSGEWTKENGAFDMSDKEIFEVFLEYIPQYKKDGSPIDLQLGGFFACRKNSDDYVIPYKKCFDDEKKMLDSLVCSDLRSSIYISPEGKLLPCAPMTGSYIENEMPNIFEKGLSAVLSDSTYLKYINCKVSQFFSENKECRECPFRKDCGGGCRATSTISGSYFSPDRSTCLFFKGGYEKRIKNVWENNKTEPN